ncbi:hypothetical protein GLYMA_09G262800v4 [Glycine max]|uniref:(+)-neomenthol dehydrogenase n=4 Tax=Glycine subgen. Soja TaxID=1462606 RepID=K7LG74_SOYBN|nr:hypothetical protein JHK86_026372 [Glycine max]KAH1044917.1 hypothetical protein GYH30_026242 [Glycine max]KRH40504.1 hypothetical protein GLYMA_09G262800v4 [Glycine max]RZB93981.1 (+)-neomenthol dehydrogenase isoform A [Glycine soja]
MLLLPNHTCDLTNEWQKQLLVLFEYFLRSSCTHVPTCASVPPPLQNLYVSKRIKVVEKGQHQLTLILFATLFFLRKLHLYFLYILSNIFGLSLFFTCSLAFSISMAEAKLRYAVVTGANKGIGFETVKELASNGVKVVLTARDEKKGHEAFERLKECGFSDLVIFHQLDVTESASISSLVEFVKTNFGKLDILVNNAGISGANLDEVEGSTFKWEELTQTNEMTEKCLTTNYYGAKKTTEAFLTLLQLSNSPRIVNVSSQAGLLKNISNEWAKGVLDDADNLTEERIDEVLKEFIKDFKEGSLATKGWPTFLSAYIVSKAAMNSYTRILAKKHQNMCINSVCPGFVKTDINKNTGILTVDQGAASVVKLALLPDGSPSGLFYIRQELSNF